MNEPITVRKRPVQCQAMRLNGNADDVLKWVSEGGGECWLRMTFGERPYLNIRTLEGVMVVSEGSWVIRGAVGEFWPVRADVFAKTYDILVAVCGCSSLVEDHYHQQRGDAGFPMSGLTDDVAV